MATLNISIPEQLRDWVSEQVNGGRYSSASDYLLDLIRTDQRNQQHGIEWLSSHLQSLAKTPDDQFTSVTSEDVKKRARRRFHQDEK